MPLEDIELDPAEIHSQALNVFTSSGTVITDADLIADVRGSSGHGGTDGGKYSVRLVSPDGTPVLFKDFGDPSQVVYDDETAAPPGQLLAVLDTHPSVGTWVLELQNDPMAKESLALDLNRWEVRLHLENAPSCEPCEFCGD